MNVEVFRRLAEEMVDDKAAATKTELLNEIESDMSDFLTEAQKFSGQDGDAAALAKEIRGDLENLFRFNPRQLKKHDPAPKSPRFKSTAQYLDELLADKPAPQPVWVSWLLLRKLGKIFDAGDFIAQSRSLLDEWLLAKITRRALLQAGLDQPAADQATLLLKLLTENQQWFVQNGLKKDRPHRILEKLFRSDDFRQLLRVNQFDNVLWFNKEAFQAAARWLFAVAVFETIYGAAPVAQKPSAAKTQKTAEKILETYSIIEKWQKAEETSEYRVVKLLEGVRAPARRQSRAKQPAKKAGKRVKSSKREK
jgi:hypothetical protein